MDQLFWVRDSHRLRHGHGDVTVGQRGGEKRDTGEFSRTSELTEAATSSDHLHYCQN